ncbi:MAG: hypothetical protein RLZZ436_4220 [Planctomycetota bacterium]|jgi:hypothetical protein
MPAETSPPNAPTEQFTVSLAAVLVAAECIKKASRKMPRQQAEEMYAMAYSYLTAGALRQASTILEILAITGNSSRGVEEARAFIAFETGHYELSAIHYYNAYQYAPGDPEGFNASLIALHKHLVSNGLSLDALKDWVALADESVRPAASMLVSNMTAERTPET